MAFGIKGHKNESFKVIDAFHLETWFHIAGPLNFDKGVLYLLLATAITLTIMLYTARHMQRRPGRLQIAVEMGYGLMSQVTRDNMDEKLTKRWFPVIFTLFVFILVTNLIGYIPLPVDSHDTFKLFGAHDPVLSDLCRRHERRGPARARARRVLRLQHRRSPHPRALRLPEKPDSPGRRRADADPDRSAGDALELLLRLLSLTIRLWANLLAGHLLIDFMAGNLAVLLGLQLLGWFTLPLGVIIYLFEAVLIAGLQAFIFAILTAIYLGGATAASH